MKMVVEFPQNRPYHLQKQDSTPRSVLIIFTRDYKGVLVNNCSALQYITVIVCVNDNNVDITSV